MFTFDERIGLMIAFMTGFIFWLIGKVERKLTQKIETLTSEIRTLQKEVKKIDYCTTEIRQIAISRLYPENTRRT